MKRFYRSRTERVIAGVCGGIGEYFNIDPVLVRVIAVALIFFGGAGPIAYLIGAVIIPLRPEEAPAAEVKEEEKGEKKAAKVPMPADRETMQKHIQLLGGLYLVFSAIFLVAAIIVFAFVAGGGWISGDEGVIAITTIIATIVAGVLVLISAPGIICGVGLIRFRPWARILAVVLGVLNLINFPFGTALGIYTIWVMMNPTTESLLRLESD